MKLMHWYEATALSCSFSSLHVNSSDVPHPELTCLSDVPLQLPKRGRASDSGGVLDRVVAQVLAEMDDLPPRVSAVLADSRVR